MLSKIQQLHGHIRKTTDIVRHDSQIVVKCSGREEAINGR
jgi:hypothetical protein